MNERIKELAVQAGAYLRDGYSEQPNGDITWCEKVKVDIIDMDVENFAQLMVQEFQNILRNNRGEDTGTLSYRVEEHFGVEK